MLRVFVYLGGGPDHFEVKVRPAGHSLAALKDGRKAHFWWNAQDLPDETPGAPGLMRSLVPHVDRLWVGRDFENGTPVQAMFEGLLVEASYDPSMVSLTALEPQRQQPYPPSTGLGVAREPLRPVPTGPMPQPEPSPVVPVAVPVHGATAAGVGVGTL